MEPFAVDQLVEFVSPEHVLFTGDIKPGTIGTIEHVYPPKKPGDYHHYNVRFGCIVRVIAHNEIAGAYPRPCPFCGATGGIWLQNTDDRILNYERLVYYACVTCEAYGPDGPTKAQALTLWNNRV